MTNAQILALEKNMKFHRFPVMDGRETKVQHKARDPSMQTFQVLAF